MRSMDAKDRRIAEQDQEIAKLKALLIPATAVFAEASIWATRDSNPESRRSTGETSPPLEKKHSKIWFTSVLTDTPSESATRRRRECKSTRRKHYKGERSCRIIKTLPNTLARNELEKLNRHYVFFNFFHCFSPNPGNAGVF